MTREEAIERIKDMRDFIIREHSPNDVWESRTNEAIKVLSERPRGTWTEEFDESANPFFQRRWRCSACNDYNYYGRPDFCPCCGADMREGDPDDRA